MQKARICITLDQDTKERLEMYAWENHSTVSKAVTDLIWNAKVRNSQIRGQLSLEAVSKK
ncbi:MAG: hypothetical protein Q4D71_13775 [Oscillospiraceae bacterium]|jgi:hypothetical protein|nr:hypothetical protein [Oscillospiraceae bacterium]